MSPGLPIHTSFMDEDMLDLYRRMDTRDLEGYRLFGDTALSMYINHRASTDFDFFCEGIVLRFELEQFEWLSNASFVGEEGMVDVIVHASKRDVVLNFVDSSKFSDLLPTYPVVTTPSGIPVAHPIDILSSKLSALASRRETRDFLDVAAAADSLHECLLDASNLYVNSPLTRERTHADLARTLKRYPLEVELELAKDILKKIDEFAVELFELSSERSNDILQRRDNEDNR